MYIPYCINVIFLIVIFQFPFCGNASNANNEATWKKNKNNPSGALKRTLLRIPITRENKDLNCYIFFTSELLGRFRFETKNAKKGTDNGPPPQQKLHVVICNYAILNYKKKIFWGLIIRYISIYFKYICFNQEQINNPQILRIFLSINIFYGKLFSKKTTKYKNFSF